MKWTEIKWRARYYAQYFPFTLHSVVCAAAVWWGIRLLHAPAAKGDTPSALLPFILVMGQVIFLFFLALVTISVLSTFYSYLYYLYLFNVRGVRLEVRFATEMKKGTNRLYLTANIQGVIRPLLGFVKGRLFYDDHRFTDRFGLLSDKRKEHSLRRSGIGGKSRIYLPDIKEYDLKGGFVYFEDMLHLVSLAVSQPLSGHFHKPPELQESVSPDVQPRKTEQMDVRVEQMRRVEGEYLNYKDFEAGDDVRRIVWSVYARNRELVVRTPELFEPFASHLYFYASFHTSVPAKWAQDGYFKEMLNYYKNHVWTVYDALSKKEFNLRYVPDQQFTVPDHLSDAEKAAGIISRSTWQADAGLQGYFSTRYGTVLCISSLTDAAELEAVLDKCDGSVVVYFVVLSTAFRHLLAYSLLKRLIFLPPKDRLSRLRNRWMFSPVRAQIRKKEKEIRELLEKSSVSWAEL